MLQIVGNMYDKICFRWVSTTVKLYNEENFGYFIYANWWINTRELCKGFQLWLQWIWNDFGKDEIYRTCARWIPRILTKECGMEICKDLPKLCEAEGDKFLHWIIAVDETRFHGVFMFDLESKRRPMEWRRANSKEPNQDADISWQSDGHCEQRVPTGFSEKRRNRQHWLNL